MAKKCPGCGRKIADWYDYCYICNSNRLVREAIKGGKIEPSSSEHLLTHCPECGRKLDVVTDDELGVTGLLCLSCWTMRVPVKMIA
ncbi:hypothetical protein ES705_42809 [subsurface metagenome]